MRKLLWIPLLGVVIGLTGCQYSRSYCRGPAVAGPVMVNRAPTRPCPMNECQPSTFTPSPLPAGPVYPTQPMPRGPMPGFDVPPGRMPATLPDVPGTVPPGPGPQGNRIQPQDPWRAAPETRNSLPDVGRGPGVFPGPEFNPGTAPGVNPILPPERARPVNPLDLAPPRIQFGTPFATPPGPGSEFAPILPGNTPANPPAAPAPAPRNDPILPPENKQQPILPPAEKPEPILPPEPDPLRGNPGATIPMRIPEPPLAIPERKDPAPDVRIRPPEPELPSSLDIPGFTRASPQVAVGQQPFFPEGADWLKKQGYRTIVHLRLPGTNDEAARRVFENRGFRFESIEVSPQTVTRQTLDQLQRILRDEANHPVFVYDRDGYLVGGMWYLKLRLGEMLDSSRALEEAQRLGLNPELDANHRAMWNAVRGLGER